MATTTVAALPYLRVSPLLILLGLCAYLSGVSATSNELHDCGTTHSTVSTDMDDEAEENLLGKRVRDMTRSDLTLMMGSLVRRIKDRLRPDNAVMSEQSSSSQLYQLVNIPIVYHLLPNQNAGGVKRPSMTTRQRDFATNMTNRLYNVYDRRSKKSIQFATFVSDPVTLVHDNVRSTSDCAELGRTTLSNLVMLASEWEYKLHVIVCESTSFSGQASFPSDYSPTHPLHNVILVDFRALACYDEEGDFLCNRVNGANVSHTRWWRTRSTVLSHEFAHLFGLMHTFQESCSMDDGISDTPTQTTALTNGCPGLLPYNKDRNLYSWWDVRQSNKGGNASTCVASSAGNGVCGSSCAACCPTESGQTECRKYVSSYESVSQDALSTPLCCPNNNPINSCAKKPGLDPLNNVMSYVPDYCSHEFTPGQLAKMMTQIQLYKTYLYCNYATSVDTRRCLSVPCASTATSPNCGRDQ